MLMSCNVKRRRARVLIGDAMRRAETAALLDRTGREKHAAKIVGQRAEWPPWPSSLVSGPPCEWRSCWSPPGAWCPG